jgi:hypothetical protein
MNDPTEQRRSTAHHEAGHAAVRFFFGNAIGIEFISMVESDTFYAAFHSYDPDEAKFLQSVKDQDKESAKLYAKRRGLFLLSGPAAEAKYRGTLKEGWLRKQYQINAHLRDGNDLQRTHNLGIIVSGGRRNREVNFVSHVADLAVEFINEPRIWKVIEAIATVLSERDRVKGPEAYLVMREAWGEESIPLNVLPKWKRRFIMKPAMIDNRRS